MLLQRPSEACTTRTMAGARASLPIVQRLYSPCRDPGGLHAQGRSNSRRCELVIAIWHDREARQSCRVLAADLVVKLGSGKVAALAQAFEDCTTLADWLIG